MIGTLTFGTLRFTIVILAIFAQIHLTFCIGRAVKALPRSDRFKSRLTLAAGVLIVVLFFLNAFALVRPVVWVDPPRPMQWLLFYFPAIWTFGSVFASLMILTVQIGCALGKATVRLYRTLCGQMELNDPADPERRQFLQVGLGGLAAAPIILSGYGALYAAKAYDVKEVMVPFGVPLRVVQLTDIHAGVYMTSREMRRYVDRIIALQPDLFVLTGDYISDSMAYLPGCLEEMVRVRARYGTFATLGNHDLWYGRLPELRQQFRKYGIPLLVNANRVIETDQGPVAVAGIDDLRTGYPNLGDTVKGVDASTPILLLSHRPEIFPDAAARSIPLTLAGHYHGGQIKLSLLGEQYSLAHFRTAYPQGLFTIGTSHLYVSAGVGTTFTPVRLNAPPEVTVIQLT